MFESHHLTLKSLVDYHTVDGRNPAALIRSLSHYLQGFIHPRWCRISSINSMKNRWVRDRILTPYWWPHCIMDDTLNTTCDHNVPLHSLKIGKQKRMMFLVASKLSFWQIEFACSADFTKRSGSKSALWKQHDISDCDNDNSCCNI